MSKSTSQNHCFYLYDLKVELYEVRGKINSYQAKIGDYFEVIGENLHFPVNSHFSMYNLAAIIPLLPAKQRETHKNDWITTDCLVTGPDPDCGAIFKIIRTKKRKFKHSETSVNKLP